MDNYDLIIVGAGPAGLALAQCMRKTYKKILIIERESEIGGCHRVRRVDYNNENTIFILPAGAGEHTFAQNIPSFINNSQNIVRHLVNYQVKHYPKENKLYQLSKYFTTLDEQKVDGYMPILNIDFNTFKNYNLPRSGRCYLIKGEEYLMDFAPVDELIEYCRELEGNVFEKKIEDTYR